jgi:hypothetical protein
MRNLYAALNLEADEAVLACVESAAAAVAPAVPVAAPVPLPPSVPAVQPDNKNIEPYTKDPEPQGDQKQLDGEAKAKQIVYDHADAVRQHLDAMDEIDRQHAVDEQRRCDDFIREFSPSCK